MQATRFFSHGHCFIVFLIKRRYFKIVTFVLDLTIHLEDIEVSPLLEDWGWLVPPDFVPVQMSKFGDWFFADKNAKIWMLDLIEGTLRQVASSEQEFNAMKKTQEKRDEWFLEGFIMRCVSEGLNLKQNECYGWKVHPILGAPIEFSNIKVFSLTVYQSIMGNMFRQIAHQGGNQS